MLARISIPYIIQLLFTEEKNKSRRIFTVKNPSGSEVHMFGYPMT